MLFSGSISGGAVSDLWEFDGAAWAEQIPSGAIPAARTAAAVAHDPVSGITTIFSGLVTPLQADTWTLTIGSGLTFGQQPQPASAFAGQTVTLHAEASGAPAIGYRWRRGGVALQDGLVASGGIITGAATDTLTISSCTMSDAGVYDVIATSACADAASVGASVIILPVCVADVDDGSRSGERDGAVGIEDLLYYLDLYDAGSLGADVDDGGETGVSDGGVGIEDLLFYLMRYDAGC
jgi:hypothetical protein